MNCFSEGSWRAVIAIAAFFAAPGLCAQLVTGNISGRVTDAGGATVQQANVTVTNEDENLLIRTTTTNSEGIYTVPSLPTGHYTVAVAAPGFAESRQTGIPLDANQILTVNFTLQVGSVHQTFTVSSEPFQVPAFSDGTCHSSKTQKSVTV